ncbi:MAG TPA: hypothetical protein VFJ58_15335 [Armatimonadota bacterium]|nr:hypothetical protein [Armatimonadota bacterium]
MDPVTEYQRIRERERMDREIQADTKDLYKRELEEAEKAHEKDIAVGLQRGWLRGWGDWRTWTWVLLFIVVGGLTPYVCFYLCGHTSQTHWHLGFPPTGPG